MTRTYAVAVRETPTSIVHAADGGETWDPAIPHSHLTATQRDGAIAAAVEAGMAYDVVEYGWDTNRCRGRRIGGTARILKTQEG